MKPSKYKKLMKNSVLYFPYIISLKAFLVTEGLNYIGIDPTGPFLKAILKATR